MSSRRQPPICHDRHERDITALIAQYGGAAWRLNEPPGSTTVADIGGLYPGTPSATGVSFSQPGPVLGGALQGAAGFDGAAGNIVVSNSGILDVMGPLSVFAWFARGPQTQQTILRITNGSTSRFMAWVVLGRFACSSRTSETTISLSTGANSVPEGVWMFGVATKAAGDVAPKIYLNAVEGTDIPGTLTPASTVGTVIGIDSGSRWFGGGLAFVGAVQRELTSDDIYALYHGAIGG